MRAMVMKSTGAWYEILTDDAQRYTARTRGKLRLKGLKTTNPIAVGDYVAFEPETTENGQAVITDVLPRENYIIRESIKQTSQGHIIAANVDQTLLIITLKQPRTSMGFIDRFLVTSEAFRIPQILVFNKTDLYKNKETQKMEEMIGLYRSIGVWCLTASAITEEGIANIKETITGKKTLFSGHSGVGKSTLLNKISPYINQTTQAISKFADKGVHTTTFAEMFKVDDKTYVIDTPGIKELGLIEIEPDELADYFPEMRERQNGCKFHNCSHIHEPKCAIKEAVANGDIYKSRYKNYVSMYYGEDNRR